MADIFDRDGDGYIDYYEFVAALHPNKDAYRPTTDADKIEDEVKGRRKWKTSGVDPNEQKLNWVCVGAGDSAGGPVQVRQEVPGGADRGKQIQGESPASAQLQGRMEVTKTSQTVFTRKPSESNHNWNK